MTKAPPETALAPRLEDQLAGMDWTGMDEEQIAPFGTFGWLHGSRTAKTPGVFYAKETEFGLPPAAPWALDERFNDGANPELGFSTAALRVAFIGVRAQWFLSRDEDGADERDRGRKQWLTEYQPGARKQVDYLCFVEGVDHPMILSGHKPTKTIPFREILTTYRRGLLKQAGLRLRRALPLWAFWLPIAGERDRDGKPVYTDAKDAQGKTYGSYVTTPKLTLPKDAINTCFVGAELLRDGMRLRQQYAWWFKEIRTPDGVVEADAEISDAPPHPALPPAGGTRNVPVAIESDDDLPF